MPLTRATQQIVLDNWRDGGSLRRAAATFNNGITCYVIYALIVVIVYPTFTIDDAYILFRYAANLADHGQLTWNINEDPVEGYTGVALTVLLAGAIKLGISSMAASKAIGIFSLLAGGFLLHRFLLCLESRRPVVLGILALYFGAPFLYTISLGGLETSLFTTVVLLCIFLLHQMLRAQVPSARRETFLLVAVLIASLVRPEGVVLAGLVIVAIVIVQLHRDPSRVASLVLRSIIFFGFPAFLYFIWRWDYYGQIFPMPFYAKSYSGLINTIAARDLLAFISAYLLIPMIVCLIVVAFRWERIRAVVSKPMDGCTSAFLITYAVASVFSLVVLAKYMNSTLMMNFSHRFFAPFFPLALLGIAWILNFAFAATGEMQSQRHAWRRFVTLLLVGGLAAQVLSYFREFNREIAFATKYGRASIDEHVAAGKWLRDNVPPEEWLIVVIDAGAIPYFSKLRTVDFGGLNDEALIHLNIDEKIDYFFSYSPGAVAMTSYEWTRLRKSLPERIAADPRFSRYRLVKRYRSEADDKYYQFLYMRDDLACAASVAC